MKNIIVGTFASFLFISSLLSMAPGSPGATIERVQVEIPLQLRQAAVPVPTKSEEYAEFAKIKSAVDSLYRQAQEGSLGLAQHVADWKTEYEINRPVAMAENLKLLRAYASLENRFQVLQERLVTNLLNELSALQTAASRLDLSYAEFQRLQGRFLAAEIELTMLQSNELIQLPQLLQATQQIQQLRQIL